MGGGDVVWREDGDDLDNSGEGGYMGRRDADRWGDGDKVGGAG